MNNNPIGILDSGVGGLTIMQAIMQEVPQESIVAVADSGNTPYGGKPVDFIHARAEKLTEFLVRQKAKLIVIACNTITVTSLDKLRNTYPEIPIVGVVPVIKTAAAVTKNKRIGILSTTTTAQSAYQKKLIEEFAHECTVSNYGNDRLVPLIEAGELTGDRVSSVLQTTLAEFKREKIDTLALGCTHFPLLSDQIAPLLGNDVQLLDSGGAVARQVKRVLTQRQLLGNTKPRYQFFTTGEVSIAKKIIGTTIEEKHNVRVELSALEL